MKTKKRPVEITVAGELPGFEYGGCRGVFLNLGLDVEMDGVTYHLSSSFAEKKEMGEVIDTTELTPQLLHEFVDKIVVHEADKSSGHRIQRIDVHYNFIGEIDFSPEYCG